MTVIEQGTSNGLSKYSCSK